MKKEGFPKYPLMLTIDFTLDMLEFNGDFAPELRGARVKIGGPKESKKAADFLHEDFNMLFPLIISTYLMELGSRDSLSESGVIVACDMVKEYFESRSGGDK